MKVFNIDEANIRQLIKAKIPLECAYVLEVLTIGGDIGEESLRFLQTLQRKGYISNKGEITEYGKELYESLFKTIEDDAPPVKRTMKYGDEHFDKWWEIYPATNHFEHKGKTFEGTQKKNIKKEECRKHFKALTNGEFTPEQVIEATRYHIAVTKELSYKKRENKMDFIPNSERYLREKYFEPYLKFIGKPSIDAPEGFEI